MQEHSLPRSCQKSYPHNARYSLLGSINEYHRKKNNNDSYQHIFRLQRNRKQIKSVFCIINWAVSQQHT